VSGALVLIRPQFELSDFEAELFVSITMLGAALAAPFGGKFADVVGRRRAIGFAALMFTIGCE
jgi:MFS family permease